MILTYKYKRVPDFADDLALEMVSAMHGLLIPPAELRGIEPLVCPVPLHWVRQNERGFNQATELGSRIASIRSWRMDEILFRTRRTGHQAHRTRSERLTALLGAFAVRPETIVPPWVLLIDDLSTTGATLEECARMLKAAGAKHVSGLVAAAG
jgi:predicted amidophosphoribosyltransferase